MRKRIVWVSLINLILSPVIFLWQILYSFFNYAEVSCIAIAGDVMREFLLLSTSTGQYHEFDYEL